MKFGGVEYHLYHKENDKSADERNISLMENARKSGIIGAPLGIKEMMEREKRGEE